MCARVGAKKNKAINSPFERNHHDQCPTFKPPWPHAHVQDLATVSIPFNSYGPWDPNYETIRRVAESGTGLGSLSLGGERSVQAAVAKFLLISPL